jgi:transposase
VLERYGRHRDKVSVIAALTVSPLRRRCGLYFYADPERYIDAPSAAEFLRGLLRHLRGAVVVLWDRGSNHRGPAVRGLLARFGRLSVEELPAYSPELNPVEQVWSWLKYGRLANYVPRTLGHLEDAAVGHLTEAQGDPALLRALWAGSLLPFPEGHCLPEDQ